MDYKSDFQKYLIRAYENNGEYTYIVFDMMWWCENFLDSFKGKNRNLLYKKCYNLIDKKSIYNRDYLGYEYASHVISFERCFNS